MIRLENIKFRNSQFFRILAISDMHIGDKRLRTSEEYYLNLTLENIKILKPDIVINAGDIVSRLKYQKPLNPGENSANRRSKCWELYKNNFVNLCPVPLLDVCLERDKPLWSKNRGKPFSHGYENKKAKFIALSLKKDVNIENSLFEELKTHITSFRGTIVLAMHYPMEGTCERDTNAWVKQGKELKELISKYSRKGIIISGHWHAYFTTPPVKEQNIILCFAGEANSLLKNNPWGKIIDCYKEKTIISFWNFGTESVTKKYVIT